MSEVSVEYNEDSDPASSVSVLPAFDEENGFKTQSVTNAKNSNVGTPILITLSSIFFVSAFDVLLHVSAVLIFCFLFS